MTALRYNITVFVCSVASVAFTIYSAPADAGNDVAEQAAARFVVPVKQLPAPAPPPAQMQPMMAVEEKVEPTTPGGKLPQYQLGHLNRSIPGKAELADARLRLLLALPGAPVLVEATITIDGKPYLMPREERVQDLLNFAANPEQHRQTQLTLKQRAASILQALKDSAIKAVTPVSDDTDEPADEQAVEVEADKPEAEQDTTDPEQAEPSDAESVPEVAEYVAPSSIYDRIERYIAATEEPPSPDELRWMLTDWVDGPVVLLLNDNYQRFRADQTPVFKVLDRDRDQRISVKELELAVSSFQECDLNRDDLIEYTELAEVAHDPRDQATQSGHGKLTFLLPNAATAAGIYERIADRYRQKDESTVILPRFDTDQNGRFAPTEIEELKTRKPDVSLSIAFNTRFPAKSKFEVTFVSPEFKDPARPPILNNNTVTISLAGTPVDLTAVQRGYSDQISVGAVDDGYPLIPVLDPDGDGRFTIRELRELNKTLATFDANNDQELTASETRSTLRVCFGLGALAHAELESIRSLTTPEQATVKTGPDWFVQMDRNKDRDLTRKEFIGSDEQFASLDADSDKLISVDEADNLETD